MDASVKTVQIVRFTLLTAIVMYMFVAEMAFSRPVTQAPAVLFHVMVALAVMLVGAIFVLRRSLVAPAESLPDGSPVDPAALGRWRAGYIVTYALSEAVALFGLVLLFLGFSMSQVAPFFVAGIVLILFFAPRQPSQAIG